MSGESQVSPLDVVPQARPLLIGSKPSGENEINETGEKFN